MPIHATREERDLKAGRARLLLAGVPIFLLTAGVAFWALRAGREALGDAGLPVLCVAALALCAAFVWALAALLRTHRALDAVRAAAVVILRENDAALSAIGTDAELVARAGQKWSAGMAQLVNERDGFKAILAAMSEGILVVDSRRSVLFANPAARKILGISEEGLLAQSLFQITQQAELLSNIEMSIVAMQSCTFEFQLPDPLNPGKGILNKRHIQAHCAPYKNEKQAFFGAVAVLHDISDLRRLERMRTEFVSNVSHELRTPLTSLIGYLETLADAGFDDSAQAREFLEVCRRQADSLSRIVEDLLRLSRLEHPQSEIADAQVSLNEVVHMAVDQCASLAAKRDIALRSETPDVDARITGDRGLLVQAVCNLIENAIHYNREKGTVTVRLSPAKKQNGRTGAPEPEGTGQESGVRSQESRANGNGHAENADDDFEWQIAVSDTGIGIPADAMQRIFERFYRVDKARSRSQGGTGLGLAIVKHIALAHGASVHVESGIGKGSTFIIRFKGRKFRSERMAAAK